MADFSCSLRSSGLRCLLRALSVLAALFVLSVSERASAATLLVVPMCGERAESIAAPPIFRAREAGSIVAGSCQHEELSLGRSIPLSPERVVVHEAPERVLGFGVLRLAQISSARAPIDSAANLPARPGVQSSLFRPPRA